LNLINKIGIGTVQFGLDYGISNSHGKTSKIEVVNILKRAKEIGVNLIDTAYAYGESEQVLGEVSVSSFDVVSKFTAQSKTDLDNQLELSLTRLNLSSLYGYLAHSIPPLLKNEEVWDRLQEIKSTGVVRKIGFSFNKLEEVDLIIKSGIAPDLVQIPFNVFDSRFEDIARLFKDRGCEVHARSCFLQGLFFCDPKNLSDFFDPVKQSIQKLQRLKNLPGSLIKFCLSQEFVDRVIIGVNNVNQFNENITSIFGAQQMERCSDFIPEKILAPSEWPK